ncbi:MATE family efflux transporter [Helicovermis profundi]|uniref:Probable multidrug resistance protein NorM n=1 Tax=Helicovermis profundi TaxID=3065157 RepID=A0AAU9EGX6_9FIRM|nr:MATE family efflux transporter [Clostridia bacterium S502]
MKKINLTNGKVSTTILHLALPIMGTSFLQMAYNLVDMIWIGKLGSKSVAAVGTAGFYLWLSMSLIRLAQTGTEVNVSQSIGAKKYKNANMYSNMALRMSLVLAIIYALILLIFNKDLIGFFNINDTLVNTKARNYLMIISIGIVSSFINPIISSIYNGSGNSKTPFKINSIGLVLNIVLDPIFIFVFNLGVSGAAIATVISQVIVSIIMIRSLFIKKIPFGGFAFERKVSKEYFYKIFKIGFPVSLQSASFTVFAMFIAKVVASFGPSAIAAQKVGTQVEALSYMTATGFSVALSTFTGQNFGAKMYDRVRSGIKFSAKIMAGYGIVISLVLFLFAKYVFMIFINEEPTLSIGTIYLQIIAISQLFMCLEITLSGAFNGLGKTITPAVISIVFTGLRVPFAYILSRSNLLGIQGIWWTITMSSVIKGTLLVIFMIMMYKKINENYFFKGGRINAK